MADISKEIKAFQEAVYGEEVRGSMVSLAEKVNTESTRAAESAEKSVKDATTAITVANTAKEQCNTAASNANAKAVLANNAAQVASDVATTVQTKLNEGDFVGPQGVKGATGEPFQIAKVYPSVSAMNEGYNTDGVKVGQFVVINTGNVDDADNAKLYLKGNTAYEFITDLSGAEGMEGPQGPQGIQGVKGDAGEKGDKGDNGSVENLEIQPLHYTEPPDVPEEETEVIPESGDPLGGIAGWLMKKVKNIITTITNLTQSLDELNRNISSSRILLPLTAVEKDVTYTLPESYKNYRYLMIRFGGSASGSLGRTEFVPTEIITTRDNFFTIQSFIAPSATANCQCGFPTATTFRVPYLINNDKYPMTITIRGFEKL